MEVFQRVCSFDRIQLAVRATEIEAHAQGHKRLGLHQRPTINKMANDYRKGFLKFNDAAKKLLITRTDPELQFPCINLNKNENM